MRSLLIGTAVLIGLGASFTADQSFAAGGVQNNGPPRAFGKSQCIECRDYQYGRPDLFYNFYVAPNCGGVGAQMYLAPVPVPERVGHTFYTYQSLMPHEMLYKHKRVYHRYYNEGRGLTRTSVRWW